MGAHQAEMDAMHEKMMARIEANMDSMQAKLISTIKNFKFNGEETTVCQETMEARLEVEEPASVDMTPEVADEEVPSEDAVVMPVGEPRERLTETVETTHRECEEPTSADMKECQETTVCHEATEADIGKMEPFDRMIAILEQMIAMTETNQETTATTDLNGNTEEMECEEPTSVEMKPEVAHEEVPREDAAVMPVRGLRKQRRGRKQAAGRREEPKKLNRGICGSRKRLTAACRKVTRRATVAWRKINVFRKILTHGYCGLRKEVTAAGIRITRCSGHRRKGRNKEVIMERNCIRRREPKNERSKGTRSRDVEELLHLRKKRKSTNNSEGRNPGERAPLRSGGTRKKDMCDISREKIMVITRINKEVFERTTRLEIAKRSAGSPVALRMIKKWTQWRGRPPPKRKKEQEAEEEPVM
jgi:hypothetical protein